MKLKDKIVRRIGLTKDKFKFRHMDRKQTFEYIYAENKWGGVKKEEFYSGLGSHEQVYVEPYSKLIKKFISDHNITSVCDLGCGDFNVASKYINKDITYYGVDIVQNIIDYHNKKYGADNVHFYCLDIVQDDLPYAQLCLIRQVLQHLSNKEVMDVLSKLKKFKYVIITEHIMEKRYAKKYNIDKVHGSHTRIEKQSGLYFDEEPFNLKIKTLLEIPYSEKRKNERLITILLTN